MDGPVNKTYYKPLEDPPRYPLELNENLHICLWSEDGSYKWTIAYFTRTSEGYELKFVGDRPLDKRVKWKHFKKCVRKGQEIADARYKEERKK